MRQPKKKGNNTDFDTIVFYYIKMNKQYIKLLKQTTWYYLYVDLEKNHHLIWRKWNIVCKQRLCQAIHFRMDLIIRRGGQHFSKV